MNDHGLFAEGSKWFIAILITGCVLGVSTFFGIIFFLKWAIAYYISNM